MNLEAVLFSFALAYRINILRGEKEQQELENARKSQELEEARQLQLSLLPAAAPALDHLDLDWHMETATEVGGDYYDYSLSDDGTLTIVLGDATGHGLQSGTMVTATKSLFRSLADLPDIVATFDTMSRSLKQMNLPRMGMAMTMVKVHNHSLSISAAGTPPMLLYRAATGQVEEVLLSGMPLGYSNRSRYDRRDLELAPGDTAVLMSDGLPERLNDQDEELGYERTEALFAEIAGATPREIIKHLATGGEQWSNGRPQDDDVTILAFTVK